MNLYLDWYKTLHLTSYKIEEELISKQPFNFLGIEFNLNSANDIKKETKTKRCRHTMA